MDPEIAATIERVRQARDAATTLLTAIATPAARDDLPGVAQALRPQPEDFRIVFSDATMAERVERAYQDRFPQAPIPMASRDETVVQLFVTTARLAALDGAIRGRFPGGYERVWPHLKPDIPWVCWRFLPPGSGSGTSYDGLVRLDDRWIWIPKPWRLVG